MYMQAINPFALSEVGRKVHGAVPRSLISLGERNTEVVSAKTVGDPASSERSSSFPARRRIVRRGEGEKPTCWPGKSKRKGRCGRVRGGGLLTYFTLISPLHSIRRVTIAAGKAFFSFFFFYLSATDDDETFRARTLFQGEGEGKMLP